MARVVSFAPEQSESTNDDTRDTNKLYARKSHLIITIINTQGQIVVYIRGLTRKKLIFHFEIKSPTLHNYQVSKYKFAPALALKWYPQGSSGSHWPGEVVLHLSSQSESGRQMQLQPSHLSFGPQEGAVLQRAVYHLALRIDNDA
mgnify:CR=1 FL=1